MSLQDHLDALIAQEGVGTWPPTPTYVDSWPSTLLSYHTTALLAPPRFVDSSALHPVRSDEELRPRIDDNRRWLTEQMAEIDVDGVMCLLPTMDIASRSGFLACLAYLAHLYRWGTLPVVRIAQDEKQLPGMPRAIREPLRCIHDITGLKTNGGSLYTMTLLNVHPTTGIVYSNMRHVAEQYPTAWDAERLNAQIFYDMERLALPLYAAIARLPGYLEDPAPLLEEAIGAIRAAFKLFADTVKEGKLKKDAWMSHAQGFHGWGVDGYDGVSGDHSLFIRTLDAFLGIPLHTPPTPRTWLDALKHWWTGSPTQLHEIPYSNDYLPTHQVTWLTAVRAANLRAQLGERPEITHMVRQLKLWRLGHTRKAVYYEDLELAERRPMTASGGVMGGVSVEGEGNAGEMIQQLEVRLRARVEATR